jgi:predicted DNA-binding transcriptional regulator YafY
VADCIVHGKDAQNVHALIEAIEGRKQVKLKNYASSNSGVVRDRWVEPFAFTMDYNQVWCYDLEDRRNKLFKTVRIETVEVMTNDWTCEAKHEMGFVDIFRYSSQERYRIKMELDVRARNVMLECFPMSEKFITQIDDNTWLLDTVVCGLQYVKNFVLMVEGAKLIENCEL